jgi:hypothetical protein
MDAATETTMTNITAVNGASKGQPGPDAASPPAAFLGFDDRVLRTSAEAIRLALCGQFETIVVKTRRSVYEILVLDGRTGDILIRGGSDFPEFCRALFVGSTPDGRALKVNTIDVGLRMEFHLGQGTLITSSVTAVSRTDRHQ